MRELPESASPEHATEAARRTLRPVSRRRFYADATTVAVDGGCAVELDGNRARTPAGNSLVAPTADLAAAIAAEWNAQKDTIDPATMPLTRLANSIIDGVSGRPGPVAAEIEKYLASDLICYRATSPQALIDRQRQEWDPILDWAGQTLGARFAADAGVVHIAQPVAALAAAGAAIPADPWLLGALHVVTTLTGSALIALALARGRLAGDDAWRAAHVDEDWNMEQWGRDELALERRGFRFAEMQAAAKVLRSLSP